ncbi:helix-turn-helix transcriptional regulator [Phyllobacterium zundukense]|uniref:Uncharacterized protein n=1 Tax=Phyllobacterium zundukense TaxID=1867719 RepID=A0A2N9W053_9HYPH|nr:hypothetical protein B5P45_08740 [Phyllobacterium zundukense]
MANIDTLPRLLRVRDVLAFSGLTEPTLWRLVKSGKFPAPVKIGPRSSAWPEEKLMHWRANLPATAGPDA